MKRMLFAVVVMLLVAFLFGEALGFLGSAKWWLQPAIAGGVGAALGGFIARRRFVPVALVVHLLVWATILYTLHAIANGQSTYAAIASNNAGPMALSFLLVVAGAFLGQWVGALRGFHGTRAAA